MTSISPRLGLVVPTTVDQFSTADIAANWGKIDAAPGTHICTSSTRPSWGASQAGRKILETNTGLEWRWDGDEFHRLAGTGILKKSNGTPAIGERDTDFSTASTTYVKVVSVTDVVIPDGNRPIQIILTSPRGTNTTKAFHSAIFRSNTNNTGPQLTFDWVSGGDDSGQGLTLIGVEKLGLAAGTYDFSWQIKCQASSGGTSVINGSAAHPATIYVVEL